MAAYVECTDREKPESGMRDEDLTARDSWSNLFCLFTLCCSGAEPSSNRSWYHSARIQRMMEKRGEFSTEVEFEIESSRVHHSEVDPAVSQTEQLGKTNREYYELLRRRKYVREGDRIVAKERTADNEEEYLGLFHEEWDEVEVEKIAEGGQAEIYECGEDMVVKVFKAGSLLQHLEMQWPPALLHFHQGDVDEPLWEYLPSAICSATLLKDARLLDRFAFVMLRCWGDLRMLIDQQMMQHSHNQGPPFTSHQVLDLMDQIAKDMNGLHKQRPPILHNDLKAANVLLRGSKKHDQPYLNRDGTYWLYVADFECSVGVMGTGFWRAPEILQQLNSSVPMSTIVFTEKCDVYSYGMTCYELITGRIPFEDYEECPIKGRDLILNGKRPELPVGLEPLVKEIIISCWHANSLDRPSFEHITKQLSEVLEVVGMPIL